MMSVLIFLEMVLGFAILTGVVIIARGGPENSLIGLNISVISTVTALVLLDNFIGFSRDIAFYLIFPGIFGVIVYAIILEVEPYD
jgi:hypothetical protein